MPGAPPVGLMIPAVHDESCIEAWIQREYCEHRVWVRPDVAARAVWKEVPDDGDA